MATATATKTGAKKTTATKTGVKKTSAKKTTARKSAATTTTAKKAAAGSAKAAPTSAVKSATDSFVEDVTEFIDEAADRAEDALDTVVRLARDAAHTYVGAGLVLQDRLVNRNFEMMSYSAFLDAAKAKGEAQLSDLQARIEPIAARFTQAVEPITDRIEATLPKQVKDVIDTSRDRVRDLLAG